MTCRECAEFLSDYLSDELPAAARATFEYHLSLCPNCVTYLEQFRATIRAGQRAFETGEFDAEADAPEELIRAILASRSRK